MTVCNAAAGVLVAAAVPAPRVAVGHYAVGGGPITWKSQRDKGAQLYRGEDGSIRLSQPPLMVVDRPQLNRRIRFQ